MCQERSPRQRTTCAVHGLNVPKKIPSVFSDTLFDLVAKPVMTPMGSQAFYEDLGFREIQNVILGISSKPEPTQAENITEGYRTYDGSVLGLLSCCVPFHQPKELRETLIRIFFQHVNPLCPIIIESDFFKVYTDHGGGCGFFQKFSSGVFAAMMFTATLHIKEEELLLQTPFSSVIQAQAEYYEIAKAAYRAESIRCSDGSANADLSRIALLLSYWCPQDSDAQINSYWVDRAIYHNTAIISSNSSKSAASWSHSLKILYWACIVRNTLVSIALRRLARLHEIKTELLSPDELYASFRAQAWYPQSPDSKAQVRGFIWTCKICKVLNSALTHIRRQIALESRRSIPNFSSMDEWGPNVAFQAASFSMQSLHLLTLRESEEKLKRLYTEYADELPDTASHSGMSTMNMGGYRNHALLHMNRIITYSSIVTLYSLYFGVTSETGTASMKRIVLLKMGHYSERVASHTDLVLRTLDESHIPISMLAWIILPATLGLVQSQKDDSWCHSFSTSFLPLTNLLAPRFKGARSVQGLFQNLSNMTSSAREYQRGNGWQEHKNNFGSDNMNATIQVLCKALRLLDLDLSNGSPSPGL